MVPGDPQAESVHCGYSTAGIDYGLATAKLTQQLFPGAKPGLGDAEKSADAPAAAVNFIDDLLFAAQAEAGIVHADLCDDMTFLRRITLDLTGRIPTLARTEAYLADTRPQKRELYIDELLESQAYVDRFAHWFNELFETSSFVQKAQGSRGFHNYLKEWVGADKPLSELAMVLVPARGDTFYQHEANYLLRAGELGVSAQDRADNEAAHYTDKFLGVSTACISCHDGQGYLNNINLYLKDKRRSDFWGMAAFLVDKKIDSLGINGGFLVQDRPSAYNASTSDGTRPPRTGGVISARYLFGGESPAAGEKLDHELARMIVADRQFARNFANRFWAHMMTFGLVEPLNEFDPARLDPANPPPQGWEVQPLQPELLEALADYFIEQGYRIKPLLRAIARSASYQLDTHYPGEWQDEFRKYYPRRFARILTGEEVYDQIATATGLTKSIAQFQYFDRDQVRHFEFASYAHQLTDLGIFPTPIVTFLKIFGTGNRYDLLRSNQFNPSQALLMMNHSVVMDVIGLTAHATIEVDGRYINSPSILATLAQTNASVDEKIRNFFLAILVREPLPAEIVQIKRLVGKRPFTKKVADVQWCLFNYTEFRLNY